VKKIGWHTNEHTFLVHAVYEEILRYTNNVKTDETARTDSINPDIIFTNESGEEIALEIETGSNLKYHRTYLERKVAQLNKHYPNRWHFILTSTFWRQRYANAFGGFVLLRHHVPRFLKRQFSSEKQRDIMQQQTAQRKSPTIKNTSLAVQKNRLAVQNGGKN
jgi:hypothetical protein